MPLPLTIGTGRALLAQSGNPALRYTNKVKALGPIAYWPQAEPSGTTIVDESGNGRNGTYVGVTLGQPGIGDGRTAAGYDGVTSYGNIYSASLAGAWNGQELTISTGVRITDAGIWADVLSHRFVYISVDANNRVYLEKQGIPGNLLCAYVAGGTLKAVSWASGSPTTWLHVAITASKTADQMKFYVNGAQVGTTQTGLGTWVGALASTLCCIGAQNTTPTNAHKGVAAHTAIFNRALSAAEIASLAVVP